MGFRELGLSLLTLVLLINLASSTYASQKTLPSESMQKKSKIEVKRMNGSKIDGGSSHGGAHGGSSHGHGDSGTRQTPQGGNAVPVYAAGAANNIRQHHRGAASCNHNKIKVFTTLMITLVYPIILLLFVK